MRSFIMKKIYLILPGILLLLVLLFGCSTGSTATKREYTTLSNNGVQLDIYYIDSKELNKVYGNNNNPYARNPNGPAITFEVTGRTGDNVIYTIDMYEVALESELGSSQPLSKKWMLSYWEQKLSYKGNSPRNSKSTVYSSWSEKLTTERIETEVLPEVWEIMPGDEIRGLILFDPLRGVKTPITFKIPVYEPSGTVVHTFEYEFTQ
jgi:hypothetical protein